MTMIMTTTILSTQSYHLQTIKFTILEKIVLLVKCQNELYYSPMFCQTYDILIIDFIIDFIHQ
jgi:hypothetical protein